MSDHLRTTLAVEISARVNISTGPWDDETKWGQVRKQAAAEVSHWTILVQEGVSAPRPIRGATVKVTGITQHLADAAEPDAQRVDYDKHAHLPELPVVYDDSGACRVCALVAEVERLQITLADRDIEIGALRDAPRERLEARPPE